MDAPKRRYTVTDKVRAANRRNLAKARAVDKAIRYRATPKRLAACRSNLLKAHQAQRRSPVYAGRFRHGLYCISLRRSFALAREKAEDFAAHVERFRAAFRPGNGVDRKLVRALAETVWRRLRAFRLQALRELRAVQHCLERAARAARECSVALQGGRGPEAGPKPGAAAARVERLGFELFNILAEHLKLERALVKFRTRMERLCRVLLGRRGVRDFEILFLRAHPSERWMAEWPPEDLNNPLVSRRKIAAAARPRQPFVKPVERWREWGTGRARRGFRLGNLYASERFLACNVMRGARMDPSPLAPLARSTGILPVVQGRDGRPIGVGIGEGGLQEPGEGARAVADGPPISAFDPGSAEPFEALLRDFEAAVGALETRGGPDGNDPNAAIYPLIARVAEATWERLQCFWRRAEVEAERLEELLQQASAALEGGSSASPSVSQSSAPASEFPPEGGPPTSRRPRRRRSKLLGTNAGATLLPSEAFRAAEHADSAGATATLAIGDLMVELLSVFATDAGPLARAEELNQKLEATIRDLVSELRGCSDASPSAA